MAIDESENSNRAGAGSPYRLALLVAVLVLSLLFFYYRRTQEQSEEPSRPGRNTPTVTGAGYTSQGVLASALAALPAPAKARAYFQSGEYRLAIWQYATLLDEAPVESRFAIGWCNALLLDEKLKWNKLHSVDLADLSLQERSDLESAKASFRWIYENESAHELADNALGMLAGLEYRTENFRLAADLYLQLLEEYPNSEVPSTRDDARYALLALSRTINPVEDDAEFVTHDLLSRILLKLEGTTAEPPIQTCFPWLTATLS